MSIQKEVAPLKQYWIPANALSVAQIEALSAQRKAKAERYLFEKDRLLCLAAGVLIDRGLQEYGLREADVRFACTVHGKPYLPEYPQIHFSVSHAGTMAVAVFSGHEIGCDVEPLLAVDADIAACFTPEEQAALRRSDDPNRDFTRLWVCKESFLKALGTGLEQPMNTFCVRLDTHSAVLEQTISPKAWKLTEYQQGDYYFAVCEEYAEGRNQS